MQKKQEKQGNRNGFVIKVLKLGSEDLKDLEELTLTVTIKLTEAVMERTKIKTRDLESR